MQYESHFKRITPCSPEGTVLVSGQDQRGSAEELRGVHVPLSLAWLKYPALDLSRGLTDHYFLPLHWVLPAPHSLLPVPLQSMLVCLRPLSVLACMDCGLIKRRGVECTKLLCVCFMAHQQTETVEQTQSRPGTPPLMIAT